MAEERGLRIVFALLLTLLLAVIISPSAHAVNRFDYGCCLPEAGDCIPGDDAVFSSADAFQSACAAANGQVTNSCLPACETGCCCAGANVPGSAEINSTNSLLIMTQYACSLKSTASLPYTFKSLSTAPAGTTCAQLCSGATGTTTGATTYALQGTIRASGAPAQATVRFYTTGIQQNTTTDATGKYAKVLPGNKQYTVSVEPIDPQCKPQSASVLLNKNIVKDFTLDCTAVQACTNNKPGVTNLALVPGTARATFNITYDDKCGDFDSFVPYVCKGTDCQPIERTTNAYSSVDNLEPATQYCVKVRVYQKPTGMVEGATQCITTGDAACMSGRTGSWCDGSSILSCDSKNKIVENACGTGKICSDTSRGPQCVDKVDCSKCNGLLGLFSPLNIKVPVGSSGYAPTCLQTPQCYLEQTFVPSYQDCAAVTSCANYTSQQSCTTNKCGKQSCQWKPGTTELGTGICMSAKEAPPCEQCDEAFGFCNKQLCESINNTCYYDGVENNFYRVGIPQCLPQTKMGCRFYDTAADCGTSTVDIRYSGTTRVSGTNARTGTDKFKYGVCNWIAAENRCIKNADNYVNPDLKEDDCIEAGFSGDELFSCLNDNTPPTTTFILKEPAIYGSSEINTLPIRVSDDVSLPAQIKTFVCINTSAAQCYPNTTLAQLRIPDVDADYRISYFSLDGNFNSEQVKSIVVKTRKDQIARLEDVQIVENER